jgi:hypothetical protein
VDDSKRLAWSVTKVFLAINGQRLRASPDAGEAFVVELVAGEGDLSVIADWIKRHGTRAGSPDLAEVDMSGLGVGQTHSVPSRSMQAPKFVGHLHPAGRQR